MCKRRTLTVYVYSRCLQNGAGSWRRASLGHSLSCCWFSISRNNLGLHSGGLGVRVPPKRPSLSSFLLPVIHSTSKPGCMPAFAVCEPAGCEHEGRSVRHKGAPQALLPVSTSEHFSVGSVTSFSRSNELRFDQYRIKW